LTPDPLLEFDGSLITQRRVQALLIVVVLDELLDVRMHVLKVVVGAALSVGLLALKAAGQEPARRLTVDEARRLVLKAIEPEGATKLPHFTLEKEANGRFPEFIFLQGLWDNPGGSRSPAPMLSTGAQVTYGPALSAGSIRCPVSSVSSERCGNPLD
jgi:hypothetical protein